MLKIEDRTIVTSDGTSYPTTSYIKACYYKWEIDSLLKEKETIEKQAFLSQETRRIMYWIRELIHHLTN